MIEYHQGYTAIKRYGRNSFRPAGKHPFKMIHNARAVKYDLIQQFEASTGILLSSGVILGKEMAVMKLQIKETKP